MELNCCVYWWVGGYCLIFMLYVYYMDWSLVWLRFGFCLELLYLLIMLWVIFVVDNEISIWLYKNIYSVILKEVIFYVKISK